MNSHPIGDLRPIGPLALDHLLTEERAFAIALGRILAEQWEQQQLRSATGATSLAEQTDHLEEESRRETPLDVN